MPTSTPARARRAVPILLVAATAAFLGACGGSSSTPTPPAPSIGVTLSTGTLAVVQGQNGTATATVTRAGGYAGAVNLAVTGAPDNVTTTVDPASVPAGSTTATLTVTTTPAAAAGSYPLVVRATGTGVTEKTASLTLTVNAAQTPTVALASSAATLAVTPGAAAQTATITLTRGGGFAGAVDLTVSGQPTGVTAEVAPAALAAEATTSTLTVTAATNATAGNATLVVTARAQGVADATVNIALTVNAAPPTGNPVRYAFCESDAPIWVAVQNGDGAWTRVTEVAPRTYDITVGERGGIAFVTPSGTGPDAAYDMTVTYYSLAEFQTFGAATTCTLRDGPKTVNGTVANVGATQVATVALGSSSASVLPVSPGFPGFTLQNVANGPLTLVATRALLDGESLAIDKVILRREVNAATGSTLPVLDFGAAEAFAPATAQMTVTNIGTDQAFVGVSFFAGLIGGANFSTASGTSPFQYAGIPSAQLATGELHIASIFAQPNEDNPTASRLVFQFFRDVADRAVALGPALGAPTVTAEATAPYLRPRVQLASQAEYNAFVSADFTQNRGGGAGDRSLAISRTAGYAGAAPATWDLTLPDFTGVDGFDPAWALKGGTATSWSVSAFGGSVGALIGGAPTDGATIQGAAKDGTLGAGLGARRVVTRMAAPRAVGSAVPQQLQARAARLARLNPYRR